MALICAVGISSHLLKLAKKGCMLRSLDPGNGSSGTLLILSLLGFFRKGIQTLVETLSLQLDVPCYTTLFLHHTETTHGGHQCLLLLAKFNNLGEHITNIRHITCLIQLEGEKIITHLCIQF